MKLKSLGWSTGFEPAKNIRGRRRGVEPPLTDPQSVVLPLHQRLHKYFVLCSVVMNQVITIMTEPDKILNSYILPRKKPLAGLSSRTCKPFG